jgi:Domain of unknown function (DUF4259)
MGTWGHGNFEDDTAADHLSEITGRLVNEITDAMANPSELTPDEYWGCAVPCNIEILSLLASQHWAGTILPDADTIEEWKSIYLTTWENYIDELEPEQEYKTQRHQLLVKTFDDLITHAKRNR